MSKLTFVNLNMKELFYQNDNVHFYQFGLYCVETLKRMAILKYFQIKYQNPRKLKLVWFFSEKASIEIGTLPTFDGRNFHFAYYFVLRCFISE